jgi:hypothetical protein
MRNDIHAPSKIKPEDYEFVALEHVKIEGVGDCHIVMQNRKAIQTHMEGTGGTYSGHDHGGNCDICGAWAVYTALFHHPGTNVYIRTGMTCADKMGWGLGEQFRAYRRACKKALANKAGKAKAISILDKNDLGDLWPIYLGTDEQEIDRAILDAQYTVRDIIGKLVRYGSISEAQMGFLRSLKKRIEDWPRIKAEREAERASAEDCPTGRMVIEGTVVKTSVKEYGHFERVVMTVKADSGFLVWGTIPEVVSSGIQRGQRIRFTGTIEPSDADPKFGFFQRPAKAEIIKENSEIEFVSA